MGATVPKVRVAAEWVGQFPKQGDCHYGKVDYADEIASGFHTAMGRHGHDNRWRNGTQYDGELSVWGNDSVWETDFRHPDFGGDSLRWSDDVHFLWYQDHGGLSDANEYFICFSKAHYNCRSSSREWRLGSKNLKWFAASTCMTVRELTNEHIGSVWLDVAQGVHLILGFIGVSAAGWFNEELGADVANNVAGGRSIADTWLDCAYEAWPHNNDAIAIAFGATMLEAWWRVNWETLAQRDMDVTATDWFYWRARY